MTHEIKHTRPKKTHLNHQEVRKKNTKKHTKQSQSKPFTQ